MAAPPPPPDMGGGETARMGGDGFEDNVKASNGVRSADGALGQFFEVVTVDDDGDPCEIGIDNGAGLRPGDRRCDFRRHVESVEYAIPFPLTEAQLPDILSRRLAP